MYALALLSWPLRLLFSTQGRPTLPLYRVRQLSALVKFGVGAQLPPRAELSSIICPLLLQGQLFGKKVEYFFRGYSLHREPITMLS